MQEGLRSQHNASMGMEGGGGWFFNILPNIINNVKISVRDPGGKTKQQTEQLHSVYNFIVIEVTKKKENNLPTYVHPDQCAK